MLKRVNTEEVFVLRRREKQARQEFYRLKSAGTEEEREAAYRTWLGLREAVKEAVWKEIPEGPDQEGDRQAGANQDEAMGTVRVRRYEKTGCCYVQLRGRGYTHIQRQRKELEKKLRDPPKNPSKAAQLQAEYDRIRQQEHLLASWMEVQEQDVPEDCQIRVLYSKPKRVLDAGPHLYQLVLDALAARKINQELYNALEQTRYPLGHKREWTL